MWGWATICRSASSELQPISSLRKSTTFRIFRSRLWPNTLTGGKGTSTQGRSFVLDARHGAKGEPQAIRYAVPLCFRGHQRTALCLCLPPSLSLSLLPHPPPPPQLTQVRFTWGLLRTIRATVRLSQPRLLVSQSEVVWRGVPGYRRSAGYTATMRRTSARVKPRVPCRWVGAREPQQTASGSLIGEKQGRKQVRGVKGADDDE